MRAITLEMTAFGPYRDKQVINFNELGDESIFLITGPTGAGKTTIFDAICYALYGRASGSDRDQDSLRSHFANIDQTTEISFIFSLKGKIYQVNRYPKQQKRKERGEGYTEDPARAELYEMDGNNGLNLISAKIKDVNESLEEMLGLDYEQFRKMIMIPQGEFRRLISENSKEREEILQKIFRTHFYQRITDELKKQSKELKQWIEQNEWKITQEVEKISWKHVDVETIEDATTDEILSNLNTEIQVGKEESTKWNHQLKVEKESLKKIQETLFEQKQLADKFEEFAQLNKTKEVLEQQLPQVIEKKRVLELAQRAGIIIPFEDQANNRKKEWQEQTQKLTEQKERVARLQKQYEEVKHSYELELAKEKEREQLKETIQSEKQQLEKLTSYYQLKDKHQLVTKKLNTTQQTMKQVKQEVENYTKEIEELEKQVNDQTKWTKAFYEMEAKLKDRQEKLTNLERLKKEFTELDKLRNEFQKVNQYYQSIQKQVTDKRETIQKLEQEQRENQAYYLAQHLHDGETCPVCGSTEHPNKANKSSESISEDRINALQKELATIEKQLEQSQENYIQIKSNGQAQRQVVEKLYTELQDDQLELEMESISAYIKKSIETRKSLEQERDIINQQINWIEQAEKQRQVLQTSKKEKTEQLEKMQLDSEKVSEEHIRIKTQLESLEQDISDKNSTPTSVQQQITKLETTFQEWVKRWELIQEKYQQVSSELQQATVILEQLQTFLVDLKGRYEEQQALYQQKVQENEFTSVDSYQSAKRSEPEQKEIAEAINEFEKRKQSNHDRIVTLQEQLENKEIPNLTMLNEKLTEQENKVDHTSQIIQQLSIQMEQYEQIKQSLDDLHEKNQSLTKQYYDIGELADLARGENHLKLSFERYVLSSFLDEILLQANIRMDQLTEHRYQLIRSDQVAKRGAQSGLDLEVIDHHTGQQRSVKTLSGGEGFKAALSLALGMADVVQAHAGGVQLETLFIDEGFGTLDELSLEQAIDCLKGLQQSNRILGIISHVPQLKEEIHAKLQISTTPQGSHATFTF
ncbi:AAA family ATPase [Aquibacillus kalidii]|uniref:AAA family ATPase n=1 Tax=Aquibacillus kalidii TaxID=2762597 RepID=UPI0016482A78|nr:AAA family ATPase [Aquibacillus kalidii]